MGRFQDLTGMRFGSFVVLKREEDDSSKQVKWLCKCDCGNEKVVRGNDLKQGKSKSCGCKRKEVTSERLTKDLTGLKFGRLTVISKDKKRNGKVTWKCKCDCGNECVVERGNLTSGTTQSCGCLHKEIASKHMKDMSSQKVGELSPHWKPELTDEDRADRRISDGYKEWIYMVKEKGSFTCDCCGDSRGGNLVSHHLDSYKYFPNKRLDINNGVCLCKKCHTEFHSWMGGNMVKCTKEDYYKFKKERGV